MGFNTTNTDLTIIAKLTDIGKQKYLSNNLTITKFALGDSEANYYVKEPLELGEVPSLCGNVGINTTYNNSTPKNTTIFSYLVVNTNGDIFKDVYTNTIVSETKHNNVKTLSGNSLSFDIVNRNDFNSDSLVNLFYGFGLPLTLDEDYIYTATTYDNGGYSNTSFSGIANHKILIVGIDSNEYGEIIDGKTIKIDLSLSGGTYTIYSTFEDKKEVTNSEDNNNLYETSVRNPIYGKVSYLFSDDINRPNGNPTLSWATGHNIHKPFTTTNKYRFNLFNNTAQNISADTVVGIAYLDKGFVVITNQEMVNKVYSGITGSTISFDSVSSQVTQNITCVADRGEFTMSTNKTFTFGDTPRISEVGVYDKDNNLIAIGKTNKHILKTKNEFGIFGIKIVL